MRLFSLTGFQRDLLYVISGMDHASGRAIMEELEADTGQEITRGRLYPNLDALVTEGLVRKGQVDRRTNYYSLSEAGWDALSDRRAWEDERLPEGADSLDTPQNAQ
jgi:DNA-binding PadR family transcriptional regulator